MPIRAVARPQQAETQGLASERPNMDIEPITVEAESAEVMKKVPSRITATTPTISPAGRLCSRLNSWVSALPSPQMDSPSRSMVIAVPPKMANQIMETPAGTKSTPRQNSRMVRPREMRARNMPTNGDQEIHQDQ